MYIPQLIIEVTRRCQLDCAHCLRGDSQCLDIDHRFICELLTEHGIDSIGSLVFTGGEPFLNSNMIAYTVSILKQGDISVSDFYIATNGIIFEESSLYTKKCMSVILDLWLFCDDKENSLIEISRDQFHETEITDSNLLHIFSFTGHRGEGMGWDALIAEGRGANVTCAKQPRIMENEFPYEYPDDLLIYLNAKGLILWNCDLSYDHQDKEGVSIKEGMRMVEELLVEI